MELILKFGNILMYLFMFLRNLFNFVVNISSNITANWMKRKTENAETESRSVPTFGHTQTFSVNLKVLLKFVTKWTIRIGNGI